MIRIFTYALVFLMLVIHSEDVNAEISAKSATTSAMAVPRQFGTITTNSLDVQERLLRLLPLVPSNDGAGIAALKSAAPPLALPEDNETDLRIVSNKYRPRVLYSGLPLIQTKGIVKGKNYLFISDTGKDGNHNEPARIWRFHPATKDLVKFYEGPLLTNSKWLFFVQGQNGSQDQLIISDYGEEPSPRAPGTGKGAKVFSIPVNSDGSAGQPRVLHAGPPLRSPEGVTVVGNTVILADWAAGNMTTRPEASSSPFISGAVFTLPLAGGPPTRLFSDKTFVTVIGVCIYYEGPDLYLRVIDIDGGRHDTSDEAALPQSGIAAFYRAKVENVDPFALGPLEEVVLTEDIPISMSVNGISQVDQVVVEGLNGGRFSDDRKSLVLPTDRILPDGRFNVMVRSPLKNSDVQIRVSAIAPSGVRSNPLTIHIDKDRNSGVVLRDNKHAGSKPSSGFRPGEPVLSATADGTSRSLVLIPVRGGTPGVIWRGDPFQSPMGVQFSPDETKLWVTDQAAGPSSTSVIFELDVPPVFELLRMFPNAFRWDQ